MHESSRIFRVHQENQGEAEVAQLHCEVRKTLGYVLIMMLSSEVHLRLCGTVHD